MEFCTVSESSLLILSLALLWKRYCAEPAGANLTGLPDPYPLFR